MSVCYFLRCVESFKVNYLSDELHTHIIHSFFRPVERFDRERPSRGRGGGRGFIRGRGRGGGMNRTFNGLDQRGKREFERQSGSDKT